MEIGSLIKAFNYSLNLTGKLSLSGEFSGTRIDADDFRRHWQGQAQLQMADTRTEGLNFQQLVQQAVERSTNVRAQENYDNATRLDSVSSRLTLDNGLVTLNRLQGQSDVMAMTGEGQLDLQKENCDMRFNVRVLGGWKGEGKLIDRLKQTAIPLRIYGEWQSLSYSLQVDQILRKQRRMKRSSASTTGLSVIKAAKTATMPKSCSISCNSYHRGPEVSGLCLSSKRNVTMMPGGGCA